jgi:hypothetical protein
VERASHKELLERKIYLNISGALLTAATLVSFFTGYDAFAVWSWALIFVAANIHLLFIRPFYVLPD